MIKNSKITKAVRMYNNVVTSNTMNEVLFDFICYLDFVEDGICVYSTKVECGRKSNQFIKTYIFKDAKNPNDGEDIIFKFWELI